MKLIKYTLAAALTVAAALSVTAKSNKEHAQRVYMFGFAASFNDTIVHFTDIQPVDSAWLNSKNDFLLGRENYSNQLRDYLTQQQMSHRTCVVFYDKKLSRLQKKFLKMKKLYTTSKKGKPVANDVKTVTTDEFRFKSIDMSTTTE